jgi:hypothetical protein
MKIKKLSLSILTLFIAFSTLSQGFLRTQGTEIINDNGPVILRSIGTGNWMIMEGYMMQSSSAGIGTHTQYRNKLVETMGEERTDEFFDTWTENHFTKTDLDSMKVWGFNAVRAALHYKTLTLPIEDEQRNGDGSLQNTWLEKGFEKIDELLSWCEQNEMYLILDMHGAPGGQGKNASISDYDENLPSLWESEDNKQKLIALWTKLAERYKDAKWIGGFDMINEPNWSVDGTKNQNGCDCENNDAIWELHQRIIEGIRTVNKNHIVYISGNCWGGNYRSFQNHGLKDADQNMVITFHKYWDSNKEGAIDKWIKMREQYQLPLWMSEGGENSNTWFSECIGLYEKNKIGWSWWPVKKSKINNVLKVTTDPAYHKLIESWKSDKPLSADATYKAVMGYAENHKIEHNTVGRDVIYAMTKQVTSNVTQPFVKHRVDKPILFADYDMGREGFAYHDKVYADYHMSEGGSWTDWNSGNYYRNDGVDIGHIDQIPYVGWTEAGEWMQYTLDIPKAGNYRMRIKSAAKELGGALNIEVNGSIVKENIQLPTTQATDSWETITTEGIPLLQGKAVIRFHIVKEGSDLLEWGIMM